MNAGYVGENDTVPAGSHGCVVLSTPALFTDWLGRPIRVGDIVVYPVRSGSSMDMHMARVVSLDGGVKVQGMRPETSRINKLHRLDRVTVIDLPGVSPQLPAIAGD